MRNRLDSDTNSSDYSDYPDYKFNYLDYHQRAQNFLGEANGIVNRAIDMAMLYGDHTAAALLETFSLTVSAAQGDKIAIARLAKVDQLLSELKIDPFPINWFKTTMIARPDGGANFMPGTLPQEIKKLRDKGLIKKLDEDAHLDDDDPNCRWELVDK